MDARDMDDRQLRRRCEEIVDGLERPEPFDLHQLCALLGRRRGRPIHLVPLPMPPGGPCGVWLATASFDAIFYEATTSRLHQDHIIGHELGHLLCEHDSGAGVDIEAARLLLPDLDPTLVQRALGRTNYSAIEEREAEIVASLLLRAANNPRTHAQAVPAQLADVVARLEHSLGHRGDYVGWRPRS